MLHLPMVTPSSMHVQKSVAFPGVHSTASTRLSQTPLQAQLPPPFPAQAMSPHVVGTVLMMQPSKAWASPAQSGGLLQVGALELRAHTKKASKSGAHSGATG